VPGDYEGVGVIETVDVTPWPRRLAGASGVFLLALGLTVLVGWFFHVAALFQLQPQWPPLTRNAAACFVLSGLALLTLTRTKPNWLVFACAGIVGALSLLTIVEYVFRVNAGIDELLGPAYVTVTLSTRGRMYPPAATCFAIAAIALLLPKIPSKRYTLALALSGSIVAAVGIATSMTFALGSSDAFGWGTATRATPLTAVGLLVFGIGMLALAWHVEQPLTGIPRWLPISVTIAVATSTVGLWQALVADGFAPFGRLPAVVLVGGCLMAPILGWTVYLAQRAHTQAVTLRRNEAFLAKVQQVSSTGGFYWWPAAGKVFWSEQVYRIFELDPAAPLTPELRQSRIHPDDLPAHREAVQQALRDARDFEYEIRLLMPDKSVKYVHALSQATRDPDGKLLYVGAVQDVTQRRVSELALGKVRSELAHIARVTTLGAVTASIAHEVNQPLSGIITNASTCLHMLGADPPDIEGARETARRTIRDGHRASEIITKLRALYSRKDPTLEPVDLNDAAREVIALSLSDLQRNGVVLRTEFAIDLPPVTGDRVQLQQVVLNLLRNASDAMSAVDDRPRELLVRTERDDGDGVRLSVRDAGVGFAPEAEARFFSAFYTTKPDGMGLGLSVSRSIVECHRGRLWATHNDGPGATFSFSLPHIPS
jgi:signal transduction histidine kinase